MDRSFSCKWALFGAAAILALPASGQNCSHPREPSFYDGYKVSKIRLESPFGFFFAIQNRLTKIRQQLPLTEGGTFTKEAYDRSFGIIEEAAKGDPAFGESPFRMAVASGGIWNCFEDATPKRLDVVFRVFTSNPIPSVVTFERRREGAEKPASTAAEDNSSGSIEIEPTLSYDASRGIFGGGNLLARIPGGVFETIHLAGSGSSTSRTLDASLDGSRTPHLAALDRAEYHIGYSYFDLPSKDLGFSESRLYLRFAAATKPLQSASGNWSARYGVSLEGGNQHSRSAFRAPADTISSSGYGALKLYAGVTGVGRYQQAALSYGAQLGGAGAMGLDYSKHIADLSYAARIPGKTHAPWEVDARFTSGGIAGSTRLPLAERFFGGNVVRSFIAGDDWRIPNGPLVRSIPENRLNGAGFGGTGFFSVGANAGKALFHAPLIPVEIESDPRFGQGIAAAEGTGQEFLALGYEAASQQYSAIVLPATAPLRGHLTGVQEELKKLVADGTIPAARLEVAGRKTRESLGTIRRAIAPDAHGRTDAAALRALVNPEKSDVRELLKALSDLESSLASPAKERVTALRDSVEGDLNALASAIDSVHNGPAGKSARDRAANDMARPREMIETLRFEVNRYSISAVAIFDAGRVWPDPFGVRYAIGGGGRFSLFNVNVTGGYAVNPNPHREIREGRGALFFSLSYANLFR